jgi:hypothetical protein
MEQSDEGHVIRTKIEDASFVDLVHDLRNLPLGVFIHAIKTINDQLTHIYTAA